MHSGWAAACSLDPVVIVVCTVTIGDTMHMWFARPAGLRSSRGVGRRQGGVSSRWKEERENKWEQGEQESEQAWEIQLNKEP